jgi:hypothetical protein
MSLAAPAAASSRTTRFCSFCFSCFRFVQPGSPRTLHPSPTRPVTCRARPGYQHPLHLLRSPLPRPSPPRPARPRPPHPHHHRSARQHRSLPPSPHRLSLPAPPSPALPALASPAALTPTPSPSPAPRATAAAPRRAVEQPLLRAAPQALRAVGAAATAGAPAAATPPTAAVTTTVAGATAAATPSAAAGVAMLPRWALLSQPSRRSWQQLMQRGSRPHPHLTALETACAPRSGQVRAPARF